MVKEFPNWHEVVSYKPFIKLHTRRSDEKELRDLFPDVKEDPTQLGWKMNNQVKWMSFQPLYEVAVPPWFLI